jgi:hypothetical protein
MISELASIYQIIDSIFEKKKVNDEQKNMEKVLIAIYQLGEKDTHAVGPDELETKGGFTKIQISDSIDMAKSKNWILDLSSNDGMSWLLTSEAVFHVEGLLESTKRKKKTT